MLDANGGLGMSEERGKISLSVTGMTCAACARRVEKALSGTDGVLAAKVNLATEKAAVEYDPSSVSTEELAGVVEGVGYGVVPEDEETRQGKYRTLRSDFLVAVVLTALILAGSLSYMLGFETPIPMRWLNLGLLALATPVQFWAGRRFYRGAWGALRHGGADMNTLVVVGTSAAYLYSAAATTNCAN